MSNDLSFLEEEHKPLTEDSLKLLGELSNELKVLRGESNKEIKNIILHFLDGIKNKISLATLEEVLKEFNKEEALISQQLIPSVLNECGLSEIKLNSGERIIVEDKVKASIANKRIGVAFSDMVKLEQEPDQDQAVLNYKQAYENIKSLFKEKILLENLTEEEKDNALNLLVEKEIPYESKLEIHWQTLAKYVKERLDSGKTIPESINVFKYQETKIK